MVYVLECMNKEERIIIYRYFEKLFDPVFYHNREITYRKKDFPVFQAFISFSLSMSMCQIFGIGFGIFVLISSFLILFDVLYSIHVYYVNKKLDEKKIDIEFIDDVNTDDVKLINALLDVFLLRKKMFENGVELFNVYVSRN